jgi:hypothetical protein
MNAVSAERKLAMNASKHNRESIMDLSLRRLEFRRLIKDGLTAVTLAIGLTTIAQISARAAGARLIAIKVGNQSPT